MVPLSYHLLHQFYGDPYHQAIPVYQEDQLPTKDACNNFSTPPLSHVCIDTHSPTLYYCFTQMTKRQEEVERIQECNCILLTNLMPDHVVNHFLNPDVKALVGIACHEACT